jgi:hypothetical protein
MPTTVPSRALRTALRGIGIPNKRHDPDSLRSIIRASLGATPTETRNADELAYAVLGIARAGMLREERREQ